MSEQNLQPGDVVVSAAKNDNVRGLVVRLASGRLGIVWQDIPHAPSPIRLRRDDPKRVEVKDLRKLVVLDPQSAYDADLLATVAGRVLFGRWATPDSINQMAKVLRVLAGEEDFVAEPSDFGAVVVDDDGIRWSRVFRGLRHPWVSQLGTRAAWSDLKVSKSEQVLSQGVALD